MLSSLNARLRVGLANNTGEGWLAMVGAPAVGMLFRPTLGSTSDFELPANSLLKEWLLKKARRFVYPSRLGFKIGGSFRSEGAGNEETI